MKKIIILILFVVAGSLAALLLTPVIIRPFEAVRTPSISLLSPNTITPTPSISIPKRITLPKLGVSAFVESVKKDSQGRMDIPKSYSNAGWYSLGPKPGESGSAVIDGHVDTPSGDPSIFAEIDTLVEGDKIIVEDFDGKTHTFFVTKGVNYPLSEIPLEDIFDATVSEKRLNLITCSGKWNRDSRTYSDRYVVYSIMKN